MSFTAAPGQRDMTSSMFVKQFTQKQFEGKNGTLMPPGLEDGAKQKGVAMRGGLAWWEYRTSDEDGRAVCGLPL